MIKLTKYWKRLQPVALIKMRRIWARIKVAARLVERVVNGVLATHKLLLIIVAILAAPASDGLAPQPATPRSVTNQLVIHSDQASAADDA